MVSRYPLLAIPARGRMGTLLALPLQSISGFAPFVKLSFSFPLVTFLALLLFDTIDDSMDLFISAVSLDALSVSPVIVVHILALTLLAPAP